MQRHVAIALLSLSGCFGGLENDPLDPGPTELFGRLDAPLSEAAWVSVVDRPELSAPIEVDGSFRISGVPSGELVVAVSNGIDQAAVMTVTAYRERPVELRFELRPAVRISGRVVLEEAFEVAESRLVRVEGLPIELETDVEGRFVVPALFAGCHSLLAEHKGFVTTRQEVCGDEGETVAVNHHLRSTMPHQSAVCGPCSGNSDCQSGLVCAAHHGESVCAVTCEQSHECPRGFECQDVSGGRACLARSSCEALRDAWHDASCSTADDCGLIGVADGACGMDGVCTVSCETELHCPEGSVCHGDGVCGGM